MESLKRVAEYTEGANPLRAETTRMVNFHVRVSALKIAYILERLKQSSLAESAVLMGEARAHIDALYDAKNTLLRAREHVHDIDASATNLGVFKTMRELKQAAIAPAEDFIKRIAEDARFLSEDDRKSLILRTFPYSENITPLSPDFIKAETAKLENESRVRAGLA